MKTLGQRLRELREKEDLSLREFAKKLGDLSAAFISDIELGRRFPSEKVLTKMARVLDVPLEELQEYDSRPPVEEIRRISATDPTYGFALRRVVKHNVGARALMDFVDSLEKKGK